MYNFLEHIYPAKEEDYNKFLSSEEKSNIDTKLRTKVLIENNFKDFLEKFGINFKEKERKLEIELKDCIILFTAQKLEKLYVETSTIQKIIKKINENYFSDLDSGNKYSLKKIFLYHISRLLYNKEKLNFGVFEGLNISFYQNKDINTSVGEIESIYKTRIQIDISEIIFSLFNSDKKFFTIESNNYLSHEEIQIIGGLHNHNYKTQKMKIQIKDGEPIGYIKSGIEENIDNYIKLNNELENGEIGHKKYKGKKSVITIKEKKNFKKQENN